nr:hypothetical protein [Sphingomonas sp. MM-1]
MFAMAVGVCSKLPDIAPDEPGPGAFMVGPDVSSTNHERPAGVADCLQSREHGVRAPSSEISAVLKSEPTRAALSDEADGFEVEARPFAFDTFSLGVGATDVLAGRASDDDGWKVSEIVEKSACAEGSNVIIDLHAGVVFGIERSPPRDHLAGRHRAIAGPVHAERPAPGGGAEQVQHAHHRSPSLDAGT